MREPDPLGNKPDPLDDPGVVARNESGPRYVRRYHARALHQEGFCVLEGVGDWSLIWTDAVESASVRSGIRSSRSISSSASASCRSPERHADRQFAARSAAIRSRRGSAIAPMITFSEPATGTARIAPATPSNAPPTMTLAIVAKPESEIAVE